MQRVLVFCAMAWNPVVWACGAYVEPMMGGGQVAQGEAGMKHADVSFENGRLLVEVDESIDTPMLRPLAPGDEFDPAGPWRVVHGHAYNFQYGWNPGRFDAFPPTGSWIWIEQLDASPQLKTYQRPPASPEGAPIFGTAGSPTRWRWSGSMTHNLYAVATPLEQDYFATYRIYIGYDATGEPLAGFEAAEVTFRFAALPAIPGDYDQSGSVDLYDYFLWRATFGRVGEPQSEADGNGDGVIGLADYTVWRDHLGGGAMVAAGTTAVPESKSGTLLLCAAIVIPGAMVGRFGSAWQPKVRGAGVPAAA